MSPAHPHMGQLLVLQSPSLLCCSLYISSSSLPDHNVTLTHPTDNFNLLSNLGLSLFADSALPLCSRSPLTLAFHSLTVRLHLSPTASLAPSYLSLPSISQYLVSMSPTSNKLMRWLQTSSPNYIHRWALVMDYLTPTQKTSRSQQGPERLVRR
jgi:hypothetical protein